MEIDFAFFADSATVPPDGKLYVLGGAYTTISVPTLPQRVGMAVVARFRFSGEDVGKTHTVELRLLDAQDKLVVAPVEMKFQTAGPPPDPAQDMTVPTVAYLQPMFAATGRYAVEYWSGDRRLYSTSVDVQEQQPAPAIGPHPN